MRDVSSFQTQMFLVIAGTPTAQGTTPDPVGAKTKVSDAAQFAACTDGTAGNASIS